MSPMIRSDADAPDLNTEIALFRYGLIAHLVHTPPDSGQQERLLREIAARTYTIPGSTRTHVSVTTLRRYLKTYREQGFEAQRPGPPADGRSARPRAPAPAPMRAPPAPSRPRCSTKPLRCAKNSPRALRRRSSISCNATRV